MSKGADGFSEVCHRCYKKRVTEKRRGKRELEKKNKAINRSKYDGFKEYKPKQVEAKAWGSKINEGIYCILQCRSCGKLLSPYTFMKPVRWYYCPNCGSNMIFYGNINFLNSYLLYKNPLMRDYSLFKFDKYR